MNIVGHNEYQIMADIYTHLDQEMMQATAEDLADVFKKVDASAQKKQMQRPASKVFWFPKRAVVPDFPELRLRGFLSFWRPWHGCAGASETIPI